MKNLLNKIALFLVIFMSFPAVAEKIYVGQFGKEGLTGWEQKSFSGETRYQLVDENGAKVLKAKSSASASGMFKKIRIDLDKTPWLNWSWKIENSLGNVDEQSKAGDDYPARIYVVVDGGFFFWKTKALNYVWSSNQPKGESWPNAYTGNARMIAIESGDEKRGQWVSERRNVREDLRRQFGEVIRYIDAVAVMTDTDNASGKAVAYYGDLVFSSE